MKNGTILPFKFKDTKKLIAIYSLNEHDDLSWFDVEHAIYMGFENLKNKCELYNAKIGFKIPQELFITYLRQRRDLTNFVINVVETDQTRDEEEYEDEDDVTPTSADDHSSIDSVKPKKRDGSDNSPTHKKKLRLDSLDSVDDEPYLDYILKLSTRGLEILSNYEKSNKLSEEDRITMIKLVICYEIKNLVKNKSPLVIDTKRFEFLCNCIVRKFPTENSSMYFFEHTKSLKYIAGGRLYEYFIEKKLEYIIQMERNYRYLSAREGVIDADFPEVLELFKVVKDWPTLYRAWQYTFEIRMAYFHNVLDPIEYFAKLIRKIDDKTFALVDYDFERIHPNKSRHLYNNWDELSARIFTEAVLVNRKDVQLIMDLYGHVTELFGCMMLSYFYENFERNARRFQKDYSGNLVIHVEDIKGTPEEYVNNSFYTETPIVYAMGSVQEIRYFVVIGSNLFQMDTVLKAVDFCFKCYQTLQIPYQSDQLPSWQVIQNAFYEIYTDPEYLVGDKFFKFLKYPKKKVADNKFS